MRLWEISLLPYLPREQLIGCWREASAIAGKIKKENKINHILVNFIMDYDFDHFISYCFYLREEMTSRGYRTMDSVWNKIISLKPNYTLLPRFEIYPEKMNKFGLTYKNICYYNLYEKYLCGGIKQEDWNRIELWHQNIE